MGVLGGNFIAQRERALLGLGRSARSRHKIAYIFI